MPDYALVPEGTHSVVIKAASVAPVRWKVSDANPDGTCLQLRLSAGNDFGFIFVDIPADHASLRKAVAAALGVDVNELDDAAGLVGREARVVTKHYAKRDGGTGVGVRLWLRPSKDADEAEATPAQAPAPAARPKKPAEDPIAAARRRLDEFLSKADEAKRTLDALEGDGDSIPF